MSNEHNNIRMGREEMKRVLKRKDDNVGTRKSSSAAQVVFGVLKVLFIVAYFAVLIIGRFVFPKDSSFFQSFDVFNKASDPIHLVRLLSYACLTLTLCIILRFVLLGLAKNRKITKKVGTAFIQLLANLVRYAAIIIIICLVLNALGVDVAGIVAGLGIIALILGLGVTSLVEDIVAGIFIIAERLFDVGDIIVVDGFRGTVVSVGIRSTKIADVGGDILTMRNSSIGSLVNLTDRQSSAAITIPIAPNESIERVEEVIQNAHIEEMANRYPKIKSGPIYIGLCDITGKGVQMLLFVAGCLEDDKYEIQRVLFHELKILFENNNIKLGIPGMVINEEE